MSSKKLWAVLGRGWWMLAIGALVGLVLAVGAYTASPKTYQSEATLLLQPSGRTAALEQHDLLQANLPTYVQLGAADDTVAEIARRTDDAGADQAALRKRLQYIPEEDTPIITVKATASEPAAAAQLTEAAVEVLQQRIGDEDSAGLKATSQIIARASEPTAPYSPNRMVLLPAGLIAGLLLGLIAALAWDRGHPRPRTVGELAEAAEVPVIGVLAEERPRWVSSAVRLGIPTTCAAVEGRLRRSGAHRMVLVTGARLPVDAARAELETVCHGRDVPELCATAAEIQDDAHVVLVVDTDCRRSALAEFSRSVRGQGLDVVGLLVLPHRADAEGAAGSAVAAGADTPAGAAPTAGDAAASGKPAASGTKAQTPGTKASGRS